LARFSDKVIDEWQLGSNQIMRVSVANYKGRDLVHVRCWYQGDDEHLYPTRNGTTITITKLPRLMNALKRTLEHAHEIGVLHDRVSKRAGTRGKFR
jgi:transcriptional coactivator p15 (PC4)